MTSTVAVQGTDGADGVTTLTINAGVEVRFNQSTQMSVGTNSAAPGALVAQGTESDPVVFTAISPQVAGKWKGIFFDNTTDATTRLEHCTIEYAGDDVGYGQGAIYVGIASPVLTNCTLQYGLGDGIYISGNNYYRPGETFPVINGGTISDFSGYGIYLDEGKATVDNVKFIRNGNYDIYLDYPESGATVTNNTIVNGIRVRNGNLAAISGNTINYNNSYPVRLHANNVGQLAAANTINNITDGSFLRVQEGTISHDATWTALMPYHMDGSITIQGTDGPDNVTTLTIASGVEMHFGDGQLVSVGTNSAAPGALVAQGTESDPVVFTAISPQVAGKWKGIFFDNTTDATTRLEHCTIEYAGDDVGYGQGAIYVGIASPVLTNCTLQYGLGDGIYISGNNYYRPGETFPVINGGTISDFSGYGIYLDEGKATVDNVKFIRNGNYDIYLDHPESGATVTNNTIGNGIQVSNGNLAAISGNTINYNDSYPVRLHANNVGQLTTSNTINNITDDSFLRVQEGTISHDATWTSALKYHILSNIAIDGTDGADGITTLTIEQGAEVRFNQNTYLRVGNSYNTGALKAQGTSNNPILFTSNEAVPAPGDWNYVIFQNSGDAATSTMDHCVIEYAGASDGAIYLNSASLSIKNTTLRYCKNAGIYARGSVSSGTQIDCNTFLQNDKGIYWTSSPPPEMHQNNFNGNTGHAIYYTGAETLNAEDNWWNTDQGPNAGGDTFSGNVDADPWSVSENICNEEEPNQPPNIPSALTPADGAVRVSVENGVALSWTGGDPNLLDIVTYDLYWGTAADALTLEVSDLTRNTHTKDPVAAGLTYYWQIIAKDDKAEQTAGPVWHFTTDGDPPDLIVSALVTDPAGNLQSGQSVNLIATVQNTGSGPVVDPFEVDFAIDGASIGTEAVNAVMPAGTTITVSRTWTYTGGDPTIGITADNLAAVTETDEQNNAFSALLSQVSDITAPVLVSTSPTDGAHLQQLQNITATLADAQNTVDDAAVIASFTVAGGTTGAVSGSTTEAADTFTFVPANLPLADDTYTVNLTAVDNLGNAQGYQFSFTIDTTPPGKPVITGGTVASGTIQPRPVQNTSDQFVVDLTGSRDPDTSVWINGVQRISSGATDWSVQITLMPGANPIEIWLQDLAGNIGPSEWVDIEINTGSSTIFEYDDTGRVRHISN